MSAQRSGDGDIRHAIYAGPDALVGAPVTRALVWINVAIFALEVLVSRSALALGSVPGAVLRLFGANEVVLTLHAGHWDTLVTSCFLHGSLLHLVFNMYALRQVGPYVEMEVGSARYAVMYVATGIAGALASAVSAELHGLDAHGSVGASGAICGVMGATVVVAFRMEGWRSGLAWNIGLWLGVTLLWGAFDEKTDNAAHVGGLVAGALISIGWRRGVPETTFQRVTSIGGAALVCLAAAGATIFRATNPTALLTPAERVLVVQHALEDGDCEAAWRALRQAEGLQTSAPGHAGLRLAVEQQCPRPRVTP